MTLDPTKHPDWKIAQDAESRMKTIEALASDLGLEALLPVWFSRVHWTAGPGSVTAQLRELFQNNNFLIMLQRPGSSG